MKPPVHLALQIQAPVSGPACSKGGYGSAVCFVNTYPLDSNLSGG